MPRSCAFVYVYAFIRAHTQTLCTICEECAAYCERHSCVDETAKGILVLFFARHKSNARAPVMRVVTSSRVFSAGGDAHSARGLWKKEPRGAPPFSHWNALSSSGHVGDRGHASVPPPRVLCVIPGEHTRAYSRDNDVYRSADKVLSG